MIWNIDTLVRSDYRLKIYRAWAQHFSNSNCKQRDTHWTMDVSRCSKHSLHLCYNYNADVITK